MYTLLTFFHFLSGRFPRGRTLLSNFPAHHTDAQARPDRRVTRNPHSTRGGARVWLWSPPCSTRVGSIAALRGTVDREAMLPPKDRFHRPTANSNKPELTSHTRLTSCISEAWHDDGDDLKDIRLGQKKKEEREVIASHAFPPSAVVQPPPVASVAGWPSPWNTR